MSFYTKLAEEFIYVIYLRHKKGISNLVKFK